MTVYIGNAVGDENNKAYGGEPGDQTGKELRIQPWYLSKKGWRVFRPKSYEVARKLADDMRAACNNPAIGYDQKQRNTLYTVADQVGFDCAKVDKPCECDCSSLVRVCLAYAGIKTGNFNTASEPSVLKKTGAFDEMIGPEYTDESGWLKTGDILVTTVKGHTAIVLNNGDYVDPRPPEPPKPEPKTKYVEVIGKSVRVRASDSVLGRTQFIAHNEAWYKARGIQHGNDTFPFVGIAPSGWYKIETDRAESYITSKTKYTKLVEK